MPINCSTYFFKENKTGYSQYPQDFTSDLFTSYREHFDTDSQIVVHRHHNLMYYTYMKKLSEDKSEASFGLSVVINGLETDNIRALFRLFERVFQQIVSDGELLTISSSGDIVSQNVTLGDYSRSFDQYATRIKKFIEDGQENFITIRPLNYASSGEDFRIVSISEDDITIRQYLSSYNKLFITKSNRTTTPQLNGLAVRIENLTEQLDFQKKRNTELERQLNGRNTVDLKWKSLAVSFLCILLVVIVLVAYCFTSGIISLNL